MKTLHITNGDDAAGILKASEITGDVLPWRDPMHHGPFPAGASLDDLREVRARHLAGHGMDTSEVERDFRLRDDHLRASAQYDRIILWFEHDLLDQLQILQLLDWFAEADIGETTLELICINSFPGLPRFRGIGELTPVQMTSLLDRRVPVTNEMLHLAREGWQAFCSDDPRHIVKFIARDTCALPFLRNALLRHFEEFPATGTGLTRTEHQLLRLVGNGVQRPGLLFSQNMDLETALFIGDWPTFNIIERLCGAGLLTCQPSPFFYYATSEHERRLFKEQALTLSEKGRNALAGAHDPADCIQRDQWLGGVRIQTGQPHWTWDTEKKEFAWHTD